MAKTDKRRVSYFADSDEYNQIEYFTKTYPERWPSPSEFVRLAVTQYVAFLNGNYELPTLEQQRLNQLIDVIGVLSSNVGSLQDITTNGFDSLLQLTRGANYLLEYDDDGEI